MIVVYLLLYYNLYALQRFTTERDKIKNFI